jgi:hypothetical protein
VVVVGGPVVGVVVGGLVGGVASGADGATTAPPARGVVVVVVDA